jgi:integrase/recombinase XerD
MWVEGTLERRYMRRSLHSLSWERGKALVEAMEKTGATAARTDLPTLSLAFAQFIAECKQVGFAAETVRGSHYILRRFIRWAEAENYKTISEVTTDTLEQYFARRQYRASTLQAERRKINGLMKYAIRKGWRQTNPVTGLPKLIVRYKQTDYLNKQEFEQFLNLIAYDAWLHTFVLLLRWSGLRIGDALRLERSRINDGVLMLFQGKTNTPVTVPLPPFVIEALQALPGQGSRFFMPDKLTAQMIQNQANNIRKCFSSVGMSKHVHPHMLRDTFAIELLLAGVPLEQVSKLLGHTSVKTTEDHYRPWVKALQDQLSAAVRAAWS